MGRGARGQSRHPIQPRGRALREGLHEADERIGAAPPEPQDERLERIERELARVRRELPSPPLRTRL